MHGVGKNSRAPHNPYWACGEIRALYETAKMSKRALLMILHRHRQTSYGFAVKLEEATRLMRKPISKEVWLDNLGSTHPAFSGEPVERSRRPDMMSVNIDKKEATHA